MRSHVRSPATRTRRRPCSAPCSRRCSSAASPRSAPDRSSSPASSSACSEPPHGRTPLMKSLIAEADGLLPQLQRLRRTLHAHPEIGLDLPRTHAAVLDALDGLDHEISTGTETTSVLAALREHHPHRPAAAPLGLLRGDLDALASTEETADPLPSTNG